MVWIDRWAAALTGPRRHSSVVLSLAAYGAIWLAYRLISTMPRDIHPDMSELYGWSLMPAWGYNKHPPLSAFITQAWFAVFPVADWSFTLLSILNIVLTLYIAWRILERWTDPMKSAFGVALLMLIPFYHFQALKYNANTVLLPVWAFTGYAFLRAFETRHAAWGILAGAGAGAAMLGKYWSIFLVVGLILAALLDPRRRRFFRSPAPYLMVLTGVILLAPHIHWMITQDDTMSYIDLRFVRHPFSATSAAIRYVLGIVAYAAVALAAWAMILRPTPAVLQDVVRPDDRQIRLVLLSFLLPNILPLPAALLMNIELTPLWALPGYSLLPLVLLASPHIAVDRRAVRIIVSIVATISVVALVASPGIALSIHTRSETRPNDYGSLLAKDISQRWNGVSDRPLSLIFGCGKDADVSFAVAYALRLPSLMLCGPQEIRAHAEILARGGVIVCAADDDGCQPQAETLAAVRPGIERFAATYQPTLFGVPGKPFSYTAYLVPPRAP